MRSTRRTAEALLSVLAVVVVMLGACTGTSNQRDSVRETSSPTSSHSSAPKRSLPRQTSEQRQLALPQAPSAPGDLAAAQSNSHTAPDWVNVTTPKHSGGGIVSMRPNPRAEADRPADNLTGLPLVALPRNADDRAAVLAAIRRIEEARRVLARGEVLEARTLLE